MTHPAYLNELSEFVSNIDASALPPSVVHAAKRVFLDQLGATLRGGEEEEIVRLRPVIEGLSSPGHATFLNSNFLKVDMFSAALLNGIQGPAVELDDGYRLATTHSGVYTFAGTLALAETKNSSGSETIAAYIAGYEVACRISRALHSEKFKVNPHAVFTALATAAASARILRFTQAQTREALSIAASLGYMGHYSVLMSGATVRNYWVGAGAREGLMATELVKAGFTGLPDAIRTTFGLLGPVFDEEMVRATLGSEFGVCHNYHKQYACNGNFDASVMAALKLRNDPRLQPSNVSQIVVSIYSPYHTMDAARPLNTLAAKFSLRYAVAAAFILGHADHEAFESGALKNPLIQMLSDKIELRAAEDLARSLPVVRPARVTVTLKDGETLSELVEDPRGHFANPFTDEEIRRKFLSLATRYLPGPAAAEIADSIFKMEDLASVREVTRIFSR